MRLEVSRKSDLAVRTLRLLAERVERVKGPEIANAVQSSAGFISQVVTPLVKEGWIRSDPGPTGGYVLTIELSKVSVLDVVEAIEGPTDSGQCVLADGRCDVGGHCALHSAWVAARSKLLEELDRVAVADAQFSVLDYSALD